MTTSQAGLPQSWQPYLGEELDKPYMKTLRRFLQEQIEANRRIFPKSQETFSALWLTPFHDVKVVILGQDPYHGPGQAHGLSFSVPHGVPIPPSLVNIYKELEKDLGVPPAAHGNLVHWAEQGVLLLNSVLTVESSQPGSHRKKGWEEFTDRIITLVSEHAEPTAFVLWGAYAQAKESLINTDQHLVLKAPHPSPLSAHRGFFGSQPFSKINRFLQEQGRKPIEWRLPQ